MFCRELFALDEAQHSVGFQTDPLGLVQTSEQKVWMTGTSAENTRVATSGSNRGASQLATNPVPTGGSSGPTSGAHQEPEGRPAKRQRIPSPLTAISSAEGHARKPADFDAHGAGACQPSAPRQAVL